MGVINLEALVFSEAVVHDWLDPDLFERLKRGERWPDRRLAIEAEHGSQEPARRRVQAEESEFPEDVVRTNSHLMQGYKPIQNDI